MDLELFLRLRRLARPVYVNAEVAAYRLHQASITMSKGASDESEVVRARFQPAAARSTRVLWRPIMAGFDRAFAASAWHLNKPAVALVDGRPYTEGQQ
jgi:hypothetical protein